MRASQPGNQAVDISIVLATLALTPLDQDSGVRSGAAISASPDLTVAAARVYGGGACIHLGVTSARVVDSNPRSESCRGVQKPRSTSTSCFECRWERLGIINSAIA